MARGKDSAEIAVMELQVGVMDALILGVRPIILYRMTEKAKGELLMPKGRKNAVEKATSLKHSPFDEYQSSPYVLSDDKAPTYLAHLAAAFKKAISSAALDIPGASKAQIGRLLWVEGDRIPIWGVPRLFMSVVRQAGIQKTPDIRTRCIVPEWATRITIRYATPMLRPSVVATLLSAAGMTNGIGDWRPQLGSGTYGQFIIAREDDERYAKIVKTGGRSAQKAAMEKPVPYDEESAELLAWYQKEFKVRGYEKGKRDDEEGTVGSRRSAAGYREREGGLDSRSCDRRRTG